jgi:hypothetical protein
MRRSFPSGVSSSLLTISVWHVRDNPADDVATVVDVEENFDDFVDLQQRRQLGECDADDVGNLLDVDFVVEKFGRFHGDVGFLLILLDNLRLDKEQLGENDSNLSRRIGTFKAENDSAGEVVELCRVLLGVADFLSVGKSAITIYIQVETERLLFTSTVAPS